MSVNKFIEDNKFVEKVKLNEKGTFDVPVDLFADSVLAPLKLKRETYVDLMDKTNLFHASLVKVAGDQVAEHFKTNPDISEVGINYDNGAWNHATVFSKGNGDIDNNVVTSITSENTYLAEIQAQIIAEFNNLDS